MPDTLFSLAILILLLLPGVVFVIQIDNKRPSRELSALRELTSIAAVGALCDFVVLVIFGIIRTLFPKATPDVGQIERVGFAYARLHFVTEGWWITGLLAASCGLAFLLGTFWPNVAGKVASGNISFTSSWWELFHQHPEALHYVSCELQDGTYLAGYVWRYSSEPEEVSDREIILGAPIKVRPAGSGNESTLDNIAAVTIKASEMKYMTVSYMLEAPIATEQTRRRPSRRFKL